MANLLLLILLAILHGSSPQNVTTDDINHLKSQIQGLTAHISQLNLKVTRANQEIEELKAKDRTQNGYCQVKSSSCGGCFCVEDYNLVEKFYCDCRNKPKRRDCKEHYDYEERVNGLYLIDNNIQGLSIIQVYTVQSP